MQTIILHGTKGSPDGNWFPWLKDELFKCGHDVYVPRLPTPENQSKENWCRALDEQAPLFDRDTTLIGHSCGATYLLHILEGLKQPVAHAVFVSGFIDKIGNKEYDDLNASFVEHDFAWQTIKANAKKITVLHGDNDPYVPLPYAQRYAEKLAVPVTVIPGGGHLNAEFGFTTFSQLLKVL